jgi:hypothetical protein
MRRQLVTGDKIVDQGKTAPPFWRSPPHRQMVFVPKDEDAVPDTQL